MVFTYDSWMWAKPNRAFCGDPRAEWKSPKGDATIHRQPHSTFCCMFVQPFSFVSYYFLKFNLMLLVFISMRHKILVERDMGTILWSIQILIRICGWWQDRLVDSIKIRCIDSPTLRSRTSGWPVVSQPLRARNWYRVPSLRSSWPCNNIQLISPKNMSNSLRILNNCAKWS
jgi:hypothetical protein